MIKKNNNHLNWKCDFLPLTVQSNSCNLCKQALHGDLKPASVQMARGQNFNHKATTWESLCRLPRNSQTLFPTHMQQQNRIFSVVSFSGVVRTWVDNTKQLGLSLTGRL